MSKLSGKQAWAVLAGGIVLYEFTCEDGQLMSEIVDEWLITRPILTRAVVAAVSLHLLNVLPWYADPLCKRLWKRMFGN